MFTPAIEDSLAQVIRITAWNPAGDGGTNPELARSLLNSLPQGIQVALLVALHLAAVYGAYRTLCAIAPGHGRRRLRRFLYVLGALGYIALAYALVGLASSYALILPLLALPVQAAFVARGLELRHVLRPAVGLAVVSALVAAVSWRFDIAAAVLLAGFALWLRFGRGLGTTGRLARLALGTVLLLVPLTLYWTGPLVYSRLAVKPHLPQPDILGVTHQEAASKPAFSAFEQLNPTTYTQPVDGAGESLIVLQQTYHPGWRAYIVRSLPTTPLEQARRLFGLGPDFAVPTSQHVVVNGSHNGWWINRAAVPAQYIQPDGSYQLIVEYWPQRLVAWGLVAGGATLVGCCYVLYVTRDRTRRGIIRVWEGW